MGLTKLRPESFVDMLLHFVHFSKELQWFSCGHVLSTSESAYKNDGFVNFIDESLAIMLILGRNYNGFLVDMFCPEVAMLESPYKNNGFVNSIFFPIQI